MVLAFIVAFFVFLKRKGTVSHKVLGWVFIISMLISCLSSFFIVTNGSYSIIHILSAVTIYWLIKAVMAVRRKGENWLYVHVSNITSAYIGIWIAGAGVIYRHFISPGDTEYWPYAAGFAACLIIPISRMLLRKYKVIKL
jgi:uncharacterized membrane protein